MENRLGEVRKNSYGTEMKIVEYNGYENTVVEFQDEHKARVHTTYGNFIRSQVRNPYDKTVYDVGYLGEGKYKVYIDQTRLEPVYNVWRTLLGRCCTERHRSRFPAYADCVVCDEWLCYQNFAEWWNKNMYRVGTERMHLDKDIKYKDNKIYSPETCIIVPQSINELFHVSGRKVKDKDLPYTIKRAANNRFSVTFKSKSLGIYDTVDKCVKVYMEAKRQEIRKRVSELENMLPKTVKEVLLNW